MAIEELVGQTVTQTTRRTVVKTGAKLAYAAPLVAATMKLSAGGAAALSGECTQSSTCGGTVFFCNDGTCYCDVTPEGTPVCWTGTGSQQACSASSQCPIGEACIVNPCGGPYCGTLCDASGGSAAIAASPYTR